MPFEAAKAVAATFCYHIRYALTPLFGLEFLELCIKPGEDGFGHMVIDTNIIRRCTEEANEYRVMSRESSLVGCSSTPEPVPACMTKWTPKLLRRRQARTVESESGYYTDTDRSDQYIASPQSSCCWTAANTPRSVNQHVALAATQEITPDKDLIRGCDAPSNSPNTFDSLMHPKIIRQNSATMNRDDEEDVSPRSFNKTLTSKHKTRKVVSTDETRAAYLLMQLHFADASLKEKENLKKRRASS